jgi:hypothetical protein
LYLKIGFTITSAGITLFLEVSSIVEPIPRMRFNESLENSYDSYPEYISEPFGVSLVATFLFSKIIIPSF